MLYTELTTEVQNYTENTFSTADINTFITQAEFRIYNTVQFPALRKTATVTLAIGVPYANAPTDFLAMHSFATVDPVSGAYAFMLNKDPNFIREAYSVPATVAQPKYYALYGPQNSVENELQFLFGPTPDKVYPCELQYFYYPQSITTVPGGATWLGDNFSPVLLYGTLVEAYTMMKGEADMLALYDSKYKEAIALAKRLGDGMEKGDTYRSGQARVQVT